MPVPRCLGFAATLAVVTAGCTTDRPARPPTPPRAALLTRAAAELVEVAAPAAGRSPAEKFAAGEHVFGVYSIHDADHCDLASWEATAPALGIADAVVLARSTGVGAAAVTVGAITDGVVDDLVPILTALRDGGGTDLDGHHVCVVPATGVGVALSTSNGFIGFEPAAILQMNELIPDSDRTMYSRGVAFAHEFAHQIQYWYGDPFDGDKSVRRTELAADCMGSAFAAMTQPSGWIMAEVEKGAVGALQAYADAKFRSVLHHGTRVDRGQMARAGIGLVTASRQAPAPLDLVTIKDRCERAVRDWDASMLLTPPDQLWGGTEP